MRSYKVHATKLIKVTLKNLSLTKDIKLLPVYVSDTGDEDPQEMVDLKCKGEVCVWCVCVCVCVLQAEICSLSFPASLTSRGKDAAISVRNKINFLNINCPNGSSSGSRRRCACVRP